MLNIFFKLFNVVFDSGIITLKELFVSFTKIKVIEEILTIIFSCLLKFLLLLSTKDMNLLCEEQAGFRKGYNKKKPNVHMFLELF